MGRAFRTSFVALSIALAGLLAAACSSDPSAAPTSSTGAPSAATQLSWLSSHVRQWNAALNSDQNAVDAAAAAGSSSSSASSTFLKNLETACSKMQADVSKAGTDVPKAPSATLQRAWKGMLSATETYATKCLKVAQSGSSSDLSDWQNSLKSMNSASATWNSAVNAVRRAAGSTSG